MSATRLAHRRALTIDIGRTIDGFSRGQIGYPSAKKHLTAIFEVPTSRVAGDDIGPYVGRVLELIRQGDMQREEAITKLVDMAMSFDGVDVSA